jgi:demethylmenaquinone methyltransferase/2-methoxy-6-polyprenyl-1,4-benzoquinol methylase
MFDGIVDRYDLLNTVLSAGLDRMWRRIALREVRDSPGPLLDLGCGTGDLVRGGGVGRVVGLDVSGAMLRRARGRLGTAARLVQGSAFTLPFADRSFNGAVSGFVLRNLESLDEAFTELARVVRPGGRVALVDITEPDNPAFRRLFHAYFDTVAPALGGLVGKREQYRYLTASLSQLPPPAEVAEMLGRARFDEAAARPLTGGIVTLFTGRRGAVVPGGKRWTQNEAHFEEGS